MSLGLMRMRQGTAAPWRVRFTHRDLMGAWHVGMGCGRQCLSRQRENWQADHRGGLWRNNRDFGRRMWERENSDGIVCGGFVTVEVSSGIVWYSYLLKTTRRRERTEKNRAKDSPENTSDARKRKWDVEKKNIKGNSKPVF